MEVAGKAVTERKSAGGSLLTKVRMAVLERDRRPAIPIRASPVGHQSNAIPRA